MTTLRIRILLSRRDAMLNQIDEIENAIAYCKKNNKPGFLNDLNRDLEYKTKILRESEKSLINLGVIK